MMVLMSLFDEEVSQILSSGNTLVSKLIINEATALVEQRIKTLKPMAYILGKVSFAGLEFISDERALVPRSPLAELILDSFDPWVDMAKVHTVLDLCTGSGCIGIALAKYFPHVQVDISDISKKALSLAQENILLHQLYKQVEAKESDLFKGLKASYDLIVSNPPYVSVSEYNELPQEYRCEPKLGLVTECSGLKIPVEIMLNSAKHLNEGGYLFLEVGYSDELLAESFPIIDFEWLEFENGGQGICVFSKEKLQVHASVFQQFLQDSPSDVIKM
jgi:ribosomal protein L3 glutamine methyltransferase